MNYLHFLLTIVKKLGGLKVIDIVKVWEQNFATFCPFTLR